MTEAKTPGAVRFEAEEIALIDEAEIILLTGWTHDEYMRQPLAVIDAVQQVHAARAELKAWAMKKR